MKNLIAMPLLAVACAAFSGCPNKGTPGKFLDAGSSPADMGSSPDMAKNPDMVQSPDLWEPTPADMSTAGIYTFQVTGTVIDDSGAPLYGVPGLQMRIVVPTMDGDIKTDPPLDVPQPDIHGQFKISVSVSITSLVTGQPSAILLVPDEVPGTITASSSIADILKNHSGDVAVKFIVSTVLTQKIRRISPEELQLRRTLDLSKRGLALAGPSHAGHSEFVNGRNESGKSDPQGISADSIQNSSRAAL